MTDTDSVDTAARSPVMRQVMDALKSGGGIAAMRPLLAETTLSPEQRDVIEFLELLEGLDHGPAPTTDFDAPAQQQHSGMAELQALRDEVTDLREVNDSAAAALGACRVCWGGDEFCPVCAGQGRPGANLPDLRLYNELVRPAVERMTATRADAVTSVRFPDEEAKQ
ncbi:hypothetical protein ACGFK1_27775 [Mycobacterium sp. NPDC048908]|uniref:hypothetical protein n=1 Tax=Mycobacterium sp. NPDC048908 TaxID=3364292 RepID=UPI0037212B39